MEDEEDDAFFFQKALGKIDFTGRYERVTEFQQAQDYLLGTPPFDDRSQHPVPHLIVSDSRLHGTQSLEVVRWVRSHPQFQNIPIVMYSGMCDNGQTELAIHAGAADCFAKPNDSANIAAVLKDILSYLPQSCEAPA